MNRYFKPLMLFRKIEHIEGDPYIIVRCHPVDNYGKTIPETVMESSNHLGLFSEDSDEKFGQRGNFPRTYSQVGLVNAVYRLSKKPDKPIFL